MNLKRPLYVLPAVLAVLALGACGSDDDSSGGSGNDLEAAFLKSMIPHHESAVEMAKMARERAEHPEVKELGGAIIEAQEEEISQMERIHERLYGEEIVPDPEAGEELGLSMTEAGMHEGGMVQLEQATADFDKVFIDQMIPHHQGAIRQAHAVLDRAEDEEVIALARAIIGAQSREIREMNSWRKRWYGARSPAGGVPSAEELPPSDGGGHESGH